MRNLLLTAVAVLGLVACGGGQSAECKKMLACFEAIQPGNSTDDLPVYGPDGTCWTQGDAYADQCTANCSTEVAILRAANPTVSACQ